MATINDFDKLDIRVGRIIQVEDFPEAHRPAYKLTIDFGQEIGIKKSSAQLIENYNPAQLINVLILGVVNFPSRQIGPFISEVLTLGVPGKNGKTVLVIPQDEVPLGAKLY